MAASPSPSLKVKAGNGWAARLLPLRWLRPSRPGRRTARRGRRNSRHHPRRQRQQQAPVKALMERFTDAQALHMSNPAGSDIAFDLRGVNGLGQYGCAAMYGCSAELDAQPVLEEGGRGGSRSLSPVTGTVFFVH